MSESRWPYKKGDEVDILVHVHYKSGQLAERRWVRAVVEDDRGHRNLFVRRLDKDHVQPITDLRRIRARSAIDRLGDLLG